jgi:hypothetical protein
MTQHRIHHTVSTNGYGYPATCDCGWHLDSLTLGGRDRAVEQHLDYDNSSGHREYLKASAVLQAAIRAKYERLGQPAPELAADPFCRRSPPKTSDHRNPPSGGQQQAEAS